MMALLIMAMIAAIFSSSIGTSVRVMASSSTLGNELQYALGRRDLRLMLEGALAALPPDDGRALFIGRAGSFEALVLPDDPAFWPVVSTSVVVASDASVTATGQDRQGKAVVRSFRLAAEGYRAEIRYWGWFSSQQTPQWHDDWPAGEPPPSLMKISLIGPGRPLPPITIRPAKAYLQSEMSLSSLVPPALPSRP